MEQKRGLMLLEYFMELHGIGDWDAGLDNAKRRLGVCKPYRRQITISKQFVERSSEEEVIDTILHEIAHAIDYERRGTSDHSRHWKAVAVEIGASPDRTKRVEYTPDYKYSVTCPKCGDLGGRHRVSNGGVGYKCVACGSEVTITENKK